MRIGIFTECYRPTINGVVFSILNFKGALEKQGHEVFVFAPATSEKHDEKGLIGCSMISHPAYPGYGLILPLNRKHRELASTLDILHAQHPFAMGHHALTVSRKYGKPIVFTNHTQYNRYSHYIPVLGATFSGTIQSYVLRFINQCDLVIAPSAGIKNYLAAKRVVRPIEIVSNGIDVDRFARRNGDRDEAKRRLGLDPAARIILYSGRIALEKNLGFLLDGFKGLLSTQPRPEVKLAVAGSGPQEDGFRRMVAEKGLQGDVVMLGAKPHDEMPKIYHAADIFATASETEVHPLTIIEALAAGLPVVAIDAMGTGDIVTHGEDGLLVGKSIDDFASALARVLTDDELRQQLSANGPANAARFSIENSTAKLLAAYDLAMAEHARRSRARA